MDPETYVDPNLTGPDLVVLKNLLRDVQGASSDEPHNSHDQESINHLEALNDPKHPDFQPTVFVSWDVQWDRIHPFIRNYIMKPYVELGKACVRNDTDVVMFTHLLLYLCTSVPSAIILYRNFSWIHGVAHWLMQTYYVGTYTLMMHQHIHMGGILSKKFSWLDTLFPYITNPLMGHTWNSYYYHHVKHHHVEGNGPDDLSSTIRYQRDDFLDFLTYVFRFFFFIWVELPIYFIRKRQPAMALKSTSWELANYSIIYVLWNWYNWRATLFVFILPLLQLRIGLMVGNWGQHAFVDNIEPNSDFRSSITLIDVASNRFCYNDGYHTSHHLNPRRHWRDHPIAFLKQKERYTNERSLTFRNIDYIMVTVKLLQKDYMHLAKCLIPMGEQIDMSLEEKAALLKQKTRKFSEEEIQQKFNLKGQ